MKRFVVKIWAMATAVVLLCTGCVRPNTIQEPPISGVASDVAEEQTSQPAVLRLPYKAEKEMNSYTTQSMQNYYVAALLYDPLVKLDTTYTPHNYLAKDIVLEDGICTVLLRDDAQFWDGTQLTAADVAYSLSLAMQSGYYAAGLSHVTGVIEDPDNPLLLTIQISRPDAFFLTSLTFPVIQQGSVGQAMPVGSGRFYPTQDGTVLLPNKDHWQAVNTFEKLELVKLSDEDTMGYSIKTGTIDFMFSDMRRNWGKSLGNGYNTVQLSNLVYLGANNGRGLTANMEIRSILSEALDRSALLDQAYLGLGTPAWFPLNPSVIIEPYSSPAGTAMTLDQRLDAAGYIERDENGYRRASYSRTHMELTLLVNNQNSYRVELAERIAQTYKALGIEVTIVESTFEEYQLALQQGEYDLYIGEVKLPYNMDMTSLLSGELLVSSGIYPSQELREASQTCLGTGEFSQFQALFEKEMPFIPLFYRKGVVAYSLNFSSNIVATEQDIFYNIQEWQLG